VTIDKPPQHKYIWFAIRLLHLPLESKGVSYDNENKVQISHKGIIWDATKNLVEQGIYRGMASSTAQLLRDTHETSPWQTYERDIPRENTIIDQLCRVLYRYTPYIESYRVTTPEGTEDVGIVLELSRCIRLFKGLSSLIEAIRRVLHAHPLSYRHAQSYSPQAAWLLTYGTCQTNTSYSRESLIQQLSPIKIDYIYEHPKAVAELKKSGFFSLLEISEHIQKSSLQSLHKRFGGDFCDYLAKIFNIDTYFEQAPLFVTPPKSYQPENSFVESIQFDYPISNCEQLAHPIEHLLDRLVQDLIKNQTQTQHICWNLYDIYQNCEHINIHFERMHSDSKLAQDLTMIQLENQPLPFEVDVLELHCEKVMSAKFHTHEIREGKNTYYQEQHTITTVTAKLNARLGENAVFKLSPKDSHIPELSFSKKKFESNTQKSSPAVTTHAETDRPSWIFNIPVKIGQQQNALHWKGKLELLQGPERIEGLWWKKPTGRDYFVAKRDDNTRLWVFHDLYKNAWFVHGVFA